MQTIKNSLGQSHDYIRMFVKEGDTVVDATCGNGNDTAFLAGLVGEKGKVFSFDIQDIALCNAKKRINRLGFMERVELIKDGHENMDKYVNVPINAVMFNLGYLPRGDHKLGTKPKTTIQAIKKAMNLLIKGGVIVVVIYYGGDSGFEEKESVLEFLVGIDQKEYIVMRTEFINQANCPPILACIEKL